MKYPWGSLASVILALSLGGCATILDGGGQVISVNTYPSGANCAFVRNGTWIGQIVSTPGSMAVDKSRKSIVITCAKPGYPAVVGSLAANSSGEVLGNVLLGPFGIIGSIIDESTGADFAYHTTVDITFPTQPVAPLARVEPPIGSSRL